jgi:hypothetical protein
MTALNPELKRILTIYQEARLRCDRERCKPGSAEMAPATMGEQGGVGVITAESAP